jgi:hypothetical protein
VTGIGRGWEFTMRDWGKQREVLHDLAANQTSTTNINLLLVTIYTDFIFMTSDWFVFVVFIVLTIRSSSIIWHNRLHGKYPSPYSRWPIRDCIPGPPDYCPLYRIKPCHWMTFSWHSFPRWLWWIFGVWVQLFELQDSMAMTGLLHHHCLVP